jgi:DNA topoisomerase-3
MLILCEKPSVAKEFAGVLTCESKKGYYRNNDVIITYCIGHLFELCAPESYNPAYKSWDTNQLPIIPSVFHYVKIPEVSAQTDIVLSLLKEHIKDTIIIATDAGREGELIARIVLMEADITDISRIKRFWVSEALTKKVILQGLKDAKPLSVYNAIGLEGFARQRTDWLIGINLTRLMTTGNKTLFSVGRVQTAILNAIAARNQGIASFKPVPFNELEAAIKFSNGIMIKALLINLNTEKTAFFDSFEYINKVLEYCQNRHISLAQLKVSREIQRPDKLLNITGLQKTAYKLYGYSPDKTLDLAQSLYEKHKCLSYPRTPSRVMGDQNVQFFRDKFALLSRNYPEYARLCDESLISADNKNIFNSAVLEDHHALIPLNVLPEAVSLQERNIYEIVLKSFFTVCMKDYIVNKKTLLFQIGNYVFRSYINEIIQHGFKEIADDTNDIDQGIPEVRQFDEKSGQIVKLDILHKETKPKKEFAIDTLLGFMENPHGKEDEKLTGLGTPATRAEIIKKLFLREYIQEEKKKLYATRKGIFLLTQLQKDVNLKKIADIAQTTEWEKELNFNPENFEKSIIQYIKNCVIINTNEKYTAEPLGLCPVCGNEILEGKKNYYCACYKAENPCTYIIWKNVMGAMLNTVDIQLLLSHKFTTVKNCVSRAGKKFKASFFMEPAGKITVKFYENKKSGSITGKSKKQGAGR